MLAGRLSDRIPAGVLGGLGMAAVALGLALLSRLSPGSGTLAITLMMALCGFGFGCFQAPNNRTMLAVAPRARSGAAGGMLSLARLLGMTLGATVMALVFHLVPDRAEPVSLMIGTAFAIAAGMVSVLRLSGRRGRARSRVNNSAATAFHPYGFHTLSICVPYATE